MDRDQQTQTSDENSYLHFQFSLFRVINQLLMLPSLRHIKDLLKEYEAKEKLPQRVKFEFATIRDKSSNKPLKIKAACSFFCCEASLIYQLATITNNYRLKYFNNLHNHEPRKGINEFMKKVASAISYLQRTDFRKSSRFTVSSVTKFLSCQFQINSGNKIRVFRKNYTRVRASFRKMKFAVDLFGEIKEGGNSVYEIESCDGRKAFESLPQLVIIITPLMRELYTAYGRCCYLSIYKSRCAITHAELLHGGFYGLNKHYECLTFAKIIITNVQVKDSERQSRTLSPELYQIVLAQFCIMMEKPPMVLMSTYDKMLEVAIENLAAKGTIISLQFEVDSVLQDFEEKRRNSPLFDNEQNLIENKKIMTGNVNQNLDSYRNLAKAPNQQLYNNFQTLIKDSTNLSHFQALQELLKNTPRFCFSQLECPEAIKTCHPYFINNTWENLYEKIREMEHTNQDTANQDVILTIFRIFSKLKEENIAYRSGRVTREDRQCAECKESVPFGSEHLFWEEVGELKQIREELCIKSYRILLAEIGATMSVIGVQNVKKSKKDTNIVREYLVMTRAHQFRVEENCSSSLRCNCGHSVRCGLPCSHELYIIINFQNKSLRNHISSRWLSL